MFKIPVIVGGEGGRRSWVEEERFRKQRPVWLEKLVCMRRMWRNDASSVERDPG
jgi:hypothetical protein